MADNTHIAAGTMPLGEYAIVEALGHRTLVGRVTEIERFGTKMLQVEPLFGDVMLGPVLLGGGSSIATPAPKRGRRLNVCNFHKGAGVA